MECKYGKNYESSSIKRQSTINVYEFKKTMEINPHNSIIQELRKQAALEKSDKNVKDLILLLFETSLLTSGFSLETPTEYAARIFRMIKLGLEIKEEETTTTSIEETKFEKVEEDDTSNMADVD